MTNIYDILKKYWGYDRFRPGQEEIIENVLSQKDVLALMPTGGGKSITYQVPSLIMDGICIVVTPLIALMKDQVETLKNLNIKALAIYSGMTYHEIQLTFDNAIFGDYKFLYISPERLETEIFKKKADKLKVNLIAVDEAHCISQWGYDFRPSYLKIINLRKTYPETPVLALTATATPEVADDIQNKLGFREKKIIKSSFTRENLIYIVRDVEDKQGYLLRTIKKIKGSGIIYVRNRKNTKELSSILNKNGIKADYYHAGLKHESRHVKQENWTKGKTKIICATNAFGMGIDKSDVRFVIHYDVPDSLEEYFQEAGRAGRDGEKAYAVLLYNNTDDIKIKKRLTTSFPEIKEIKRIYNAICNYYQIPVGSGKGNVFDFHMADFCSVYKLNTLKTFNSLKILEREGYIEITDELNNPSKIFFVTSRDDLYKFQIANQSYDAFIKLLLRSYTGLFSNYVAIDEALLAGKTGLSQDDIYQYLVKLAKQKIINYIPRKKTPLIIFNEERLDDKTLKISTSNYKERKNRFEKRIENMKQYACNNNLCRNILLLNYFGEKTGKSCGTCDNCLKDVINGLTNHEFQEIKSLVLKKLNEKKIKTEEIHNISNFNQEKNIKALRILLDSEIITYDSNYYLILKK